MENTRLTVKNGNVIEIKDSSFKRESVIEAMKNNMEYSSQEHSQIGIFWYDVLTDSLFGVNKVDSEDIDFVHTSDGDIKYYKKLHKDIWKKEFYKEEKKRPKRRLFIGDYTLVPRGRVSFYKDDGYVVFVGDWIDKYPTVKQDIIDEFELPNDTQFVKDEHWNIGHGWSEEIF